MNNKLYSQPADNEWETRTSGFTDSSWFSALKGPLRFNKLTENLSTDVVVVGGGCGDDYRVPAFEGREESCFVG